MKFIIIVEGRTEKLAIQDFLKRWLDNKLVERVGVKQRPLSGGKVEQQLTKQALAHLEKDDENEILGVIGLLDLYGMSTDFDFEGKTKGPDKLFKERKKTIEKQVNHDHFKMFFAVHEFEAWLLSDPGIFQQDFRGEINKYSAKPENVNFDNHPSKLLQDIYRRKSKRHYMKTIDGHDLFGRLDPQLVYDKCPYFKMMLDEMVKLALGANLTLKQ